METFTLSNGIKINVGDKFKETYEIGYSIYEVCFGEYDNGEGIPETVKGVGFYLEETAYHRGVKQDVQIVDLYSYDLICGEKYEETVNPDLPPPPPPENPNGRE